MRGAYLDLFIVAKTSKSWICSRLLRLLAAIATYSHGSVPMVPQCDATATQSSSFSTNAQRFKEDKDLSIPFSIIVRPESLG
jgi:hypothetical protein